MGYYLDTNALLNRIRRRAKHNYDLYYRFQQLLDKYGLTNRNCFEIRYKETIRGMEHMDGKPLNWRCRSAIARVRGHLLWLSQHPDRDWFYKADYHKHIKPQDAIAIENELDLERSEKN